MAKIQIVELPVVSSNAKSVTIHIKINPPTGSVLIRAANTNNKPIKFHGPQQIGAVALNSAFVTVELADGATTWELQVRGYAF